MDRPTHLSGRTGEEPEEGSDDVVRAFRAALGGTDASSSSTSTTTTGGGAAEQLPPQRPSALLSAVERRAAQLQRRRRATVLGGTAAAAAVALFVAGLVVPGFDLSLGGASSSSAGGASSESGDSGAGGSGGAAPAASAPAAAGAQDRTTPTTTADSLPEFNAAGVPTLSEASMLTAADLTGAFSVPVQESAPAPESTSSLTLGACVDGDAGSVDAQQLWRVDLAAAPSAAVLDQPGVVERVAVVADPAAAASALTAVSSAVPGCASNRLEGTGPVTELDATTVTPDGGRAVVLASTSGQGAPTLQVIVAVGSELVQLQVTSDAASAAQALERVAPAVRTAVTRATGGAASFSTPLSSTGAP